LPQKLHFTVRELGKISAEMFAIELRRKQAKAEELERRAIHHHRHGHALAGGAVVALIGL